MLIEQEKEESAYRKHVAATEQKLELSAKKRNKKALIDELVEIVCGFRATPFGRIRFLLLMFIVIFSQHNVVKKMVLY